MTLTPSPDTDPLPSALPRVTHLFFLLLAVSCMALGYWAWSGTLDIVSIADGEVIPSGRVKHIQHLEGGIIRTINVREGDTLITGQPLVELEQLRSGAGLEEIQMRINALEVDILRYGAEVNDSPNLIFPEAIQHGLPQRVKEARGLFHTRKNNRQSTLNKLHTIIQQREQHIKTIQAKLKNKEERLPLLKEELNLSQDLLKDNLTTRFKHIQIMRQVKKTEGDILNDRSALIEARHALKEAQEKRNETLFTFKEEATQQLKSVTQERNELLIRLKKFKDSMDRTIIRSPINGVVKRLYRVTPGGVVKPGDTLADIVPSEEKLIIEAHLNIGDIGYIKKGQTAFLQLPNKDARKFGKLKGHVTNISPDTFTNTQGRTYYNVRIESDKSYFEAGHERYQLYPGMILLASIPHWPEEHHGLSHRSL